jgi:hypothetical protein
MLRLTKDLTACCCITGRSLLALQKVGDKLSVDRINPRRGYVKGNMQLMALSLNRAKAAQMTVPKTATNQLLRKLSHVTEDCFSTHTGAIQET